MINHSDECLAIRGNHDEVVIREYLDYLKHGNIAEKNSWMKRLNKLQFEYLNQLPYTISIPSLNIIVVHAGLVPNVDLEQQKHSDMVTMRNLVADADSNTPENGTVEFESARNQNQLLRATKSSKEGLPWASAWHGPMHVYFGHDAQRKLQEYPFATGLDTGVVYGGSLTSKFVKGPRSGQYLSVKALKAWKPIETIS